MHDFKIWDSHVHLFPPEVYENWENQVLLEAGKEINYFNLGDFDPIFNFCAPAIAATGTTCSEESSDDIKECIVTLSDTRQVVCVVYSGYKHGGLSCDWSHVSGADKEPAR